MTTRHEQALQAAARVLNQRLAAGDLYGVTRDIVTTYLSTMDGKQPLIEELAEMYFDHLDEAHRAMQFGGYIPTEDDSPVEVPLRILRLASELHGPPTAISGDRADQSHVDRFVITGISEHTGERVWLYYSHEGGGWWQWGPEKWAERFESKETDRFRGALLCAPTTGPWRETPKDGSVEVRAVPAIITVS